MYEKDFAYHTTGIYIEFCVGDCTSVFVQTTLCGADGIDHGTHQSERG